LGTANGTGGDFEVGGDIKIRVCGWWVGGVVKFTKHTRGPLVLWFDVAL
jgi:hypothetical protein